ncbi:MAG: hypothetical protein E6G10_14155 [Actinobacteria bacterium]|nr:MAG: hypothetical protein E6G10_14155 [Actinomycetota bacterium]
MRRCLPLAVAALALAPAAEARVVSIPPLFSAVLPAVKREAGIPVRLPSRADLDTNRRRLYATGRGRRGSYDLELAAAPGCGGATACFVASFTARRARRLGERPNVDLALGLRGVYRPLRCGASCSPPSIAWVQRGVRYDMQISVSATQSRERATMTALANSAIRSGPR